jgi:hypothetical protein
MAKVCKSSGEGTFAEGHGNGEVAAKAALRHAASDSTSIGRLRTCVGGENGFDRFAASKPMLPNQWQR